MLNNWKITPNRDFLILKILVIWHIKNVNVLNPDFNILYILDRYKIYMSFLKIFNV